MMCMWLIDAFMYTNMCGVFLEFMLDGQGEGGLHRSF